MSLKLKIGTPQMIKIKVNEILLSNDMNFTLQCMMNFIKMYNLDWQIFSESGYTAKDIENACQGKDKRARLFRIYANRKTRMTTDDS